MFRAVRRQQGQRFPTVWLAESKATAQRRHTCLPWAACAPARLCPAAGRLRPLHTPASPAPGPGGFLGNISAKRAQNLDLPAVRLYHSPEAPSPPQRAPQSSHSGDQPAAATGAPAGSRPPAALADVTGATEVGGAPWRRGRSAAGRWLVSLGGKASSAGRSGTRAGPGLSVSLSDRPSHLCVGPQPTSTPPGARAPPVFRWSLLHPAPHPRFRPPGKAGTLG